MSLGSVPAFHMLIFSTNYTKTFKNRNVFRMLPLFQCICVARGMFQTQEYNFAEKTCENLPQIRHSPGGAFVNAKVLRAAAEGESGCRDSHGLTAIQMTQSRSFGSHRKARSRQINAGVFDSPCRRRVRKTTRCAPLRVRAEAQ